MYSDVSHVGLVVTSDFRILSIHLVAVSQTRGGGGGGGGGGIGLKAAFNGLCIC